MENQTSFKSGFIALIGRPNSGKSTLMNTILGEQLSIVTPLPQTTRKNIRGIYTTDSMQLVFVDTPGIHKGKYAFNDIMIKEAQRVIVEGGLDLVCYLVDLSRDFGEEEAVVGKIVSNCGSKLLILFNKIDECKSVDEKIEEFYTVFPTLRETPSLKIAAIDPKTKDLFIKTAESFIHEGPKYYPEDEMTDENLRFFASEYLRKHVILNAREEVPHATFVEIESYKEQEDRHIVIATIHVETVGQRGIIVGKQGSIIKKIRRGAEAEMAKLTGVPVTITCHVKVTPKWRDNERFLRSAGYLT